MDPNYQHNLPKCSFIGEKSITKEAAQRNSANEDDRNRAQRRRDGALNRKKRK